VANLRRFGLYTGETLHGARGGGVVAAGLSRATLEALCQRAGWEAESGQLQNYTGLAVVLAASGREAADFTVEMYSVWDALPMTELHGRGPYLL
jgi:hypothetical protein